MRPLTAQDRIRQTYSRRIEVALATALALHLAFIQFAPPRSLRHGVGHTPAALQLIDPPQPAPHYRIVTPVDPPRPTLTPAWSEILFTMEADLPPVPEPEAPPRYGPGGDAGTAPGIAPFEWWDQEPVPVKQVSPDYPLIAREARAEGNVVVAVRIDAQGKVLWARVVSSSAVPALEEAARRAALGWLFRPARQRDQAVPATLHIPFRFRLGN